jgi:arylsulfatase
MSTSTPNILLIVIDCLRADRTFDPDRSAQTPNLTNLAEKGVLFSHLITANSMTIPCMTTMFSGMYPAHHGVRAMVGARVSDDVPLMAEILRENGYHTYAEATGPLSPFYRLDRGFDHYSLRDGVKSPLLGEWGDDLFRRFRSGEFREPWFVYLHLWGVHRPRQILPDYNRPEYGQTEYDRAVSSYDARLKELFDAVDKDDTLVVVTGDHGEKIPETNLEGRVEFLKKSLSKETKGKKNTGLIRARRQAIATVRSGWVSASRLLYRVGLVDSPLATVTGHGYHVYDSLVRVPLVMAGGPILATGKRIPGQVRQIDIMPTILELVGLGNKTPVFVDGRSLVPLMYGENVPEEPAFIETCQNSREPSSFYGVRFGGFKFAFDSSNPGIPQELYDLTTDPDENTNLATALPQKAAELRMLIEQHIWQNDTTAVSMTDEMSDAEMDDLAEHLRKLGYVE